MNFIIATIGASSGERAIAVQTPLELALVFMPETPS
jgi:hypothetical protein